MGKQEALSKVGDYDYPRGFKTVTSSNITAVLFEAYNKEFHDKKGREYLKKFPDAKGVMVIRFKGEKFYRYVDVPYTVYAHLVNAPSVGSYFANNIRDKYKGEKL